MSFFSNSGTPTPSTNTAASPFGTAIGGSNINSASAFGGSESHKTSGGLFAGPNLSTPAANAAMSSGGGLFSNPPKASTPALGSGGGLFGGASTSSSLGTSGGLFGPPQNPSNSVPSAGVNGGLFGGPKTDSEANKASSSTNSLFGGASPFSLSRPGDPGAKPAASSPFNQPTTAPSASAGGPLGSSTASGTINTPSLGGGLFSLPSKPVTSTSTSSSPSISTGLFGGTTFNQGSSTSTLEKASTSSLGANKDSSPAPTSNLFSGMATGRDGEKKGSTSVGAPDFSLFSGAKPVAKKEETLAGPKEGDKHETASTDTNNALNASSLIAVQPPSMLKGKSLEEIVNRWTSDLETNIAEFNKFAAEVSAWDRLLIENGNDIAALYNHVLATEREQNDINESIEHIEQQQKDLASTLDHFEKASQDILGGSLRALDTGPADNERDKNFMLATELYTQLDDLSDSLKQMIDSVNSLSMSSKPAELTEDPLSQISQILSSHLESLQWIDSAVREVESKTHEVEKRIKDSGHGLSTSKARAFGVNR